MFGGANADQDQTSESERSFQREKFEQVCEILISAGYFRARIATLSPFDKIVGGLCWCITNSGEAVDVDILFQENSTIGQRIQLSEQIVSAMRKMRCPSQLSAHQIQGSDFPAIFPVIVWLIKKFFENREATARQIRLFSTLQFAKDFTLPDDDFSRDTAFLGEVADRYRPQRRFRRLEGARRDTEESRVHAVLLEYGEKLAVASERGTAGGEGDESAAGSAGAAGGSVAAQIAAGGAGGLRKAGDERLSGFERQYAAAQKAAEAEEREAQRLVEAQEKELMGAMAALEGGQGGAISGSSVGRIVGLQSAAIQAAAASHDEQLEETRRLLEAEAGGLAAVGKRGQVAAYKRQKAVIQRKMLAQAQAAEEARAELALAQARAAQVQEEFQKATAYNARLEEETAKLLAAAEQSQHKSDLDRLRSLVMLNENLKGQMAQFKTNCGRQRTKLQASLQALQSQDNDDEESARLREIEEMHTQVLAKYNQLRVLLASKNQAIAATSRLIDDVPTRTELIQYERRFVELYDQVASKLDETRKYFSTYNALDDTRKFLLKEVTLINSISENFVAAMRTKQSKEQFLQQFEAIIKGVQDTYAHQQGELEHRRGRANQMQEQYQQLVDKQRRYFSAVKEFQEECDRNEMLSARVPSA